MKVTIIHPCVGRTDNSPYIRSWQMEPLSAAYLKALTPKNVELAFYDDRLELIPYATATSVAKNFAMAKIFLVANLILRREYVQRNDYPLGDKSHDVTILKIAKPIDQELLITPST